MMIYLNNDVLFIWFYTVNVILEFLVRMSFVKNKRETENVHVDDCRRFEDNNKNTILLLELVLTNQFNEHATYNNS